MASSLPFTLSAADSALFQELQASAVFPELATPGEGELAIAYKKACNERLRERMEIYADLLLSQILDIVDTKKAAILAQLKKAPKEIMEADIFSWNTVVYDESFSDYKRRLAAMTSEERFNEENRQYDERQCFEQNGWEHTIGLSCEIRSPWGKVETVPVLSPQRIERIYRHSNLAERVALALGPNFMPYMKMKRLDLDELDGKNYAVFCKTLTVIYMPFGRSKSSLLKALEVARLQKQREADGKVRTIGDFEMLVGVGDYPRPAITRGFWRYEGDGTVKRYSF
jgi:hypothetical protein